MDLLGALGILVRVVETGSFSAVARERELSQAAVARQVSQLEEHFGVRLFHRTTRKLKLTDLGAIYYEHCLRILQEAEQADHAMTESGGALRGTIRVTAPWLLSDVLEPV